jgi:hypothetical protein
MTNAALIASEAEGLPADYMGQVLDFIIQLKRKALAPKADGRCPSQVMFDEAARLLGYKDDLDYLRVNTPLTLEEAEADAERKFNDPNRQPFSRHYGCLKGDDCYGDGMEYQRMMRSEWPD